MTTALDSIMVLLVLSSFAQLGSSRIATGIRMVALQGLVLSCLPVLVDLGSVTWRDGMLSIGTVLMRAALFPWILLRTLRDTGVRREIEPYVGYTMSMIAGAVALGLALWLDRRLPLPHAAASPLMVPVAFFLIFSGLFALLSRRQAVSQVVGYLVLENGIYCFGMALAHEEPLLIELGVLLDVFVALFIMGIAIFHIHREFEHIDTDRMTLLKDEQV